MSVSITSSLSQKYFKLKPVDHRKRLGGGETWRSHPSAAHSTRQFKYRLSAFCLAGAIAHLSFLQIEDARVT
jgi:hypothetical protein